MACLHIFFSVLELCNLHILHRTIMPMPTNKILSSIQKHTGKVFFQLTAIWLQKASIAFLLALQ